MTTPRQASARAAGRAEAAGPSPVTAGLAAGTVQIRLMGSASDTSQAAALIASHPAFAVVQHSPGHANRRGPGERAYLTVRIAQEDNQS